MAADKEPKEKKKILNLEDFVKESEKLFGKNTIISANETESYGDVIPTTPFSLRNALGIGGFAKRKFYLIDGETSGGKSTTSYDIIGNAVKSYGDECLVYDKEDSYTKEYGSILGIDNLKLKKARIRSLEDMYDSLIMALESNLFGVILVDSVTAFAPEGRHEGNVTMGLEARVNSDKMRLVMDALEKSNTCLIFIAQLRQKIGGYGDPNTINGGTAIPFYAHVRIRITRSEIDRENQQNVVKFTVIKNKLAAPFKVGTVVYKWGVGFDLFSEIAELAIEFGIIRNEKTSYYFPIEGGEEVKIVGKKNAIAYLKDNPDYTRAVMEPKVKEILESSNVRKEEFDEADIAS